MSNNKNQINVKFTDEQIEIISTLVGVMGGTAAEVVRSIFLSWLSDKGILSEILKKKVVNKKDGK